MYEVNGKQYLVKDIFLEITNICNDRCSFCPYTTMTRKKGFMDYKLYCSVIDQVAEDKIGPYVALCIMGEPLLHKKVYDMVKYATYKDVGTMIFTNLSYLNEETIERLYKSGLSCLALSLHVHEEESYKKARKNILDFSTFYKKAVMAVEKRFMMDTKTKIEIHNMYATGNSDYNFVGSHENAEKIYDYWTDIVYKMARLAKKTYRRPDKPDFNKLLDGTGIIWLTIYEGISVVFKRECYSIIKKSYENVRPAPSGSCNNPFEQIGILWDGSVTYCCLDYDGKLVFGNIRYDRLKNIWESEKGEYIREQFKKNILPNRYCQHCQGQIIK